MLIVYLSITSLLTVFLHRCGVQAQATTTLTETRFVTQTSMTSADVTCAKVVNVTGICRRRRGFKLDTPIVLIFDETMDIDLEQPLSPTQTLRYCPSTTIFTLMFFFLFTPVKQVNVANETYVCVFSTVFLYFNVKC